MGNRGQDGNSHLVENTGNTRIQQDLIASRSRLRFATVVLMTKVTRFLNKNSIEMAQVDTLYNAIQSLVFGHIPNFILPHDTLIDALEQIQAHLDEIKGIWS